MSRSRTAQLAERLAATVFTERPRYASPPVDVEGLARELGVGSIRSARMVEDGRLEQRGGNTWMVIRDDVRKERRRFTIAHELGHLLLANPSQEFVVHRTLSGVDREERFCDAFAAALLLPRTWVLTGFGAKPEKLATLRQLADASDASLAASTLRLREVVGWTLSLLHWRRHEQGWRLASTTGLPRGLRVTSAPTTSAVLDHLASSWGDRTAKVPLAVAGGTIQLDMEIAVRKRSAIALTSLEGVENQLASDPLLARLQSLRRAQASPFGSEE